MQRKGQFPHDDDNDDNILLSPANFKPWLEDAACPKHNPKHVNDCYTNLKKKADTPQGTSEC